MDLLRTAMVDVTTLVATCHALKSGPAEDGEELQRKLRRRLRRDIKRGTVAYIDTQARIRRGAADDVLLAKCRVAAERQMARALAHQELLNRILTSEAASNHRLLGGSPHVLASGPSANRCLPDGSAARSVA